MRVDEATLCWVVSQLEIENHAHMVALYTVWYNFVRQHKTHRLSPAMAAGITDRLWSLENIAGLVEATAPKPGPRRPYRRRTKGRK
jgi:hypothetical protein